MITIRVNTAKMDVAIMTEFFYLELEYVNRTDKRLRRMKMAELCPMCKKHEAIINTRRVKTIIKGVEVEHDETYYFCSYLGEDDDCAYFVTAKVMDENLRRAKEAYEATKG